MEIPFTLSLTAAVWTEWIGAVLCAAALAALAVYGLYRVIKSKRHFIHIVAGMLAGTAILTTLFTMIILKDWTTRMTQEITDRTMSVSGLAARLIPGDKLEKICSIRDYNGEDYQEIRSIARNIFTSGEMDINDLYCVIYRIQNGMITSMYSVEDYVGKYSKTVSVTKVRNISVKKLQDDMQSFINRLEKNGSIDADKISAAKSITVKMKIKGEEQTIRNTYDMYLVKIGMAWKVLDYDVDFDYGD